MEENRRILAVDDDESALKQYRKIFTMIKRPPMPARDGLVDVLQDALEGKVAPDAVERPPYQLDCFLQGEEAIVAVKKSLLEQRPYAVALVDMRMSPGIDGLETGQQIRELDPDIEIIFVTAYSDYTTDSIFHQISGAVLWFRKPFHSEEIYQVVRNSCIHWNHAHELDLLRQDLADRVDLQTERLQTKMQSVEILQKNALKRELKMGDMKRELRSLKAYQDLRLLLKEEPLPEPKPINLALDPVKLLLVDDSATVRAINKTRLEGVGFEVLVAESVDEAFKIALQHPLEVALIDYYMPGGNGDKLISLLRSDPHTLYVLPLLFTNAGDEMMAVEAGAIYWMIKDQPAFLIKMELIRDYIQKNRDFQAAQLSSEIRPENRRVLLVDDEQQNLDTLCVVLGEKDSSSEEVVREILGYEDDDPSDKQSTLERPSFELTPLTSGEDAIVAVREAQFAENPYAVALIDMRMPRGMSGLETARQIRQISPQIDIVIMTAYSDYTLEQIQLVLGKNFSFLIKPYVQDVVLQRVVEGCAKWAAVHEVNASHHALLNLADDMDQENTRRKQAEKELEKAGQQLQKSARLLEQEKTYMEEIFFSMQEPLLVVDHTTTIQGCNMALLKLIGTSREAVVGKKVDTIFVEAESSKDKIQRHIMSLFQSRLQQIHDHDYQAFHLFLQSAEMPLVVFNERRSDGLEGKIFLINGEMEKLLGYASGSLLGVSILELLPELEQRQLEEVVGSAENRLTCMEGRQFHWKCADGSRISSGICMFHINCRGAPHVIFQLKMDHPEGQDLLLLALFGKILSEAETYIFTQQMLSLMQEDMLRIVQRGKRLDSYCQQLPLPMIMVNSKAEISVVNPPMEKLTGWSREALIGERVEKLIPAPMHDLHQKMVSGFIQNPEVRSMGNARLLPLLTQSGEEVVVEIGLIPLKMGEQQQIVVLLHAPNDRESLEVFKSTQGTKNYSEQKGQREELVVDRMLRCSSGDPIPVSASGSLLHNIDGGTSGVVLMLHDLRERKKAEQREQYSAFQSGVAEMTANILHNVGNTIQGMGSATSDLGKHAKDLGSAARQGHLIQWA